MRKQFESQLALGTTPINEVEVPTKTRSHIVALVAALQPRNPSGLPQNGTLSYLVC